MLIGLALIMNVGSVAAATSTGLTTQTKSVNGGALATNSSTKNLVSTTSTKTLTSQTSTKTTVSLNTYGLTYAQIKDGQYRAQKFYNLNLRLPNYVSFGTTKVPISSFQQILASKGLKIYTYTPHDIWYTVKNLVYDHQDTGYTCGPSSLKMELSAYGMNLNEMGLASYAGTNSNTGTTHSGLISAVSKVNTKYGTHFRAWDTTFTAVGWPGLYRYITHGTPVILHIKSFLSANSGHYVVLMGLNLKLRLAKLADPSYGYRIISFDALKSRMNWAVSTGRTSEPVLIVTKS